MTSYSCRSERVARTTARSANSLARRLLFGIIGSACFGRGAACCAPTTVGAIRGLPRRQLALPPLPLRCGVHGGEAAAVVPEDVEPTLSPGQTVVVDPIGRELAVDPAHHPFRSHAGDVAGSGS